MKRRLRTAVLRRLYREERLQVRRPAATKRAAGAGQAASLLQPTDQPLFEALKALRCEVASEQRVPAYVAFADRSLIDMARGAVLVHRLSG